jgi:3-oxoadipate enol-lactonase
VEVAARRPELVGELVLLAARVADHDWSQDIVAFAEEEDRLLEEDDLDAAADLNARFWAPAVADRVLPMQRRSFELQISSAAEEVVPESIDLAAIKARTLVIVGEDDKEDFLAIAGRLADEISDAELVTLPGVGHLPALEQQEETATLVRRFLRV